MISGYVSSDEEDYDDFYSDPPVKRNEVRNLPPIETKQIREEFLFLVEHNKKIELFLKAAEESDLNTLEKLISLGEFCNQ